MTQYLEKIDGYSDLKNESEISKKHGIDFRLHKGRTHKIVDRYHPDKIKLIVSEIIDETEGVKTIRLIAENGYLPPFQGGQYINVYGDVHNIKTSRPYSISSSPKQRAYFDITVAQVEDGFFSNYLLNELKKGDVLTSSGPSGNFYYNPLFHKTNSVYIAGGSGITPFMSMIREIYYNKSDRKITLLYGNRKEENIIFHEELLELSKNSENIDYVPVISEPSKNFKGQKGFIDRECIKNTVKDTENSTFYLCGPEAMYDFCLQQLNDMGIPAKRIRKEMFSTASDITKEKGWPEDIAASEEFTIKVKNHKSIKARAGESILASLEREGIVVPVNCRCGECSVCRIKLVSGKVFQPRGVLLREADARFGYIHSCKTFPLEDLEIIL